MLAEDTYKFGFFGITAGDWLAKKLYLDYGMQSRAIGFSYDSALYMPIPKKPSATKRVCFYARPPTTRRGCELGVLALSEVTKKYPDMTVCFAGWNLAEYSFPFNFIDSGMLELKDLPNIYCQCDVALVLSFTNLSLLPLEIMACGVPVVCNSGENNEWLLNHNNAKLVNPTREDIAEGICELLENHELRKNLIKEGLATATKNHEW